MISPVGVNRGRSTSGSLMIIRKGASRDQGECDKQRSQMYRILMCKFLPLKLKKMNEIGG